MQKIFRLDSVPWKEAEPKGTAVKVIGLGDGKPPWIYLVRYDPHTRIERHQHGKMTQVRVILEGSMKIGQELCEPGMVHVVEKNTLYGPLEAGDSGVTFLLVSDVDPSSEDYKPITT